MAERLNLNDMEMLYPSQSGERAKWFSIKEDRGTRKIRFLYNTVEDIFVDVVHEVRVNNYTKQIQCLNARGANPADCPFCKSGYKQNVRIFIPVLDVDKNEVLIWSRPKTFGAQLQGLAARNNPLSGMVFEIQRNGAKGSTSTQYIPFPMGTNDGKTVQQLLQEYNVSLPSPESYMSIMDFNGMNSFVANMEAVSGNVPVNRNQNTYGQSAGGYANNSYGGNTYANNQYQSTTPMTPPATQPLSAPTAANGRNIGNEPVRRNPQPMPNAGYNTPVNNPTPNPVGAYVPVTNTSPMPNEDDLPF